MDRTRGTPDHQSNDSPDQQKPKQEHRDYHRDHRAPSAIDYWIHPRPEAKTRPDECRYSEEAAENGNDDQNPLPDNLPRYWALVLRDQR